MNDANAQNSLLAIALILSSVALLFFIPTTNELIPLDVINLEAIRVISNRSVIKVFYI